jgi:hypothetical protein
LSEEQENNAEIDRNKTIRFIWQIKKFSFTFANNYANYSNNRSY